MAKYEFKLPDIGEGIAEAEIVAWHVKVGDRIEEDQQIADMMTDKATVEMESPVAGKVVQLAGEVGDQIPIGSVLAVIETDGAAAAEAVEQSEVEVPLADGAAEPTPAQQEAIPTTAVEEAPTQPEPAPAPKQESRGHRARRGSCQGPDLAGRSPARPRPRHRPWPGEDDRRPDPPLRSRRLSALQRRQRFGPRCGSAQRRDNQGRRPAPQDRREHGGGETPHPALHLGRGVRRHRARRDSRDDEPRSRRQSEADAPALPDHRHVARTCRTSRCSTRPTTTKRTSSLATARCTSAWRRRRRTA